MGFGDYTVWLWFWLVVVWVGLGGFLLFIACWCYGIVLVLSTGARVCGCFLVLPDCSGLDCVVMVVYCLAVRVFLWYSFSGVCLGCVIVMVFMFDVLVVLVLDDFGLY